MIGLIKLLSETPHRPFEWQTLLVLLLLGIPETWRTDHIILKEKMRNLVRIGLFVSHFIALMRTISYHFTSHGSEQ